MDQSTFIKKLAIWTAVITAVIIALIGLCFGKVIEGSLFAEIAKWVFMGTLMVTAMISISSEYIRMMESYS